MIHNRYQKSTKVILRLLILIIVFLIVALFVYLPLLDSPSMVYYENQEWGFSIEYPDNWEFIEDDRVANDFSLQTSKGLFSKQGAWMYFTMWPASMPNTDSDAEESIASYLQVYGATRPWNDHYEIVQVSSVSTLNNHEIISGTVTIPTLYIDEQSLRNQLGQQDANIFQVVHIYVMRNIHGDEITVEVYEGRDDSLNKQAKQIVQSIRFLRE